MPSPLNGAPQKVPRSPPVEFNYESSVIFVCPGGAPAALADGRAVAGHAVYRRRHAQYIVGLAQHAAGHPQTAGCVALAVVGVAPAGALAPGATAFARRFTRLAAVGCQLQPCSAVWADACAAAGGLGHARCRRLSAAARGLGAAGTEIGRASC